MLNEADVDNSHIMVQPTLMSYTFDVPPRFVLLDSISIKPDETPLFDTFLHILIFYGEVIAQWRKVRHQDQEGYENCKELLEAHAADAPDLPVDHFPTHGPSCEIGAAIRHDSCQSVDDAYVGEHARLGGGCRRWTGDLHRRRELAGLHGTSEAFGMLSFFAARGTLCSSSFVQVVDAQTI